MKLTWHRAWHNWICMQHVAGPQIAFSSWPENAKKKGKSFWSILRAENCCEFFHKQLTWPRRRQLGKTRARHSRNSFMARSLKLIGLPECGRRGGGRGMCCIWSCELVQIDGCQKMLLQNWQLAMASDIFQCSHTRTRATASATVAAADSFPFPISVRLSFVPCWRLSFATGWQGEGREERGGVATNAKVHAMTFRFGCTCQRGVYATRARIFCSTHVINKCRRTHTHTHPDNWHAKVYIANVSTEIYVKQYFWKLLNYQ